MKEDQPGTKIKYTKEEIAKGLSEILNVSHTRSSFISEYLPSQIKKVKEGKETIEDLEISIKHAGSMAKSLEQSLKGLSVFILQNTLKCEN